jgi:hypothetical protein
VPFCVAGPQGTCTVTRTRAATTTLSRPCFPLPWHILMYHPRIFFHFILTTLRVNYTFTTMQSKLQYCAKTFTTDVASRLNLPKINTLNIFFFANEMVYIVYILPYMPRQEYTIIMTRSAKYQTSEVTSTSAFR